MSADHALQSPKKLVHTLHCGCDSLQFSDGMSDVTWAVLQTPAETYYIFASYSQLVE